MASARIQWAIARTGPVARLGSRLHAAVYKKSGGRLGSRWFGAEVMALETVGRRSGKSRSTAVLCVRQDGGFVVAPVNAGSSRVPAWWLNLESAGEGVAVVRGERHRVRPRVTEGEERERLWAALLRAYPQADDYTRFTEREFPVVLLEPV